MATENKHGSGCALANSPDNPPHAISSPESHDFPFSSSPYLLLAGMALDNAQEGILITDANGTILTANPAVSRVTGYELEEIIGQNPRIFSSNQHPPEFFTRMWKSVAQFGHWRGEILNRRKSGEVYPEWLSIMAIRDRNGKVKNYVAFFSDISAQKNLEDQLHRLAFHDSLTGLPNRVLFRDHLAHVISVSAQNSNTVALLYVDIDNFKAINDTLGHAGGDYALRHLAKCLEVSIRPNDMAARLGGDEFVVLLENVKKPEDAAVVAERILDACTSRDFEVDGSQYFLSASVGISLFPEDGTTADELLKQADEAMYYAKRQRNSGYEFYLPEMASRTSTHLVMTQGLCSAIERNELSLHFQPIVKLESGVPVGAEVLLRWNSPHLGNVQPSEFICAAEASGFIHKMGRWVLQNAIQQGSAWQAENRNIKLSVNLSAKQVMAHELPGLIRSLLAESSFPPEMLELELTESTALIDCERSTKVLGRLKDLGVSIAIDDFGTGYASLSYLKRFPFDTLKLDRSFVQGITSSNFDFTIVSSLCTLARELGKRVVAEGVETEEQANCLAEIGCELSQGYYFGHPLTADDFIATYGSRIVAYNKL